MKIPGQCWIVNLKTRKKRWKFLVGVVGKNKCAHEGTLLRLEIDLGSLNLFNYISWLRHSVLSQSPFLKFLFCQNQRF